VQEFQGKVIVSGAAKGPALVTHQPINFTAAHCKPANLLPGKKSQMWDRHHELFKRDIQGKVLIFPSCIGSTHTGLVLLDLISMEKGPVALLVKEADSLLVSGITLADVWFEKSIPIIELPHSIGIDYFHNDKEIQITETGLVRLIE